MADREAEPPLVPATSGADNASLVQVAGAQVRSRIAQVGGSPPWRRVVAWSRQPLVTTRGTALLAGAIVMIMLGQAALLMRRPVRPAALSRPAVVAAAPLMAVTPAPRRSPPAPATASATAPAALGDPPQVVGIVGRLPGNAVVLVRGPGGTHSVAVGGVSGDWTLVELSPTEAVFERDGARRSVELPASE